MLTNNNKIAINQTISIMLGEPLSGVIHDGTRLKDELDADSLDLLALAMEIEKGLSIVLEESKMKSAETVGDIYQLVEEALTEKSAVGSELSYVDKRVQDFDEVIYEYLLDNSDDRVVIHISPLNPSEGLPGRGFIVPIGVDINEFISQDAEIEFLKGIYRNNKNSHRMFLVALMTETGLAYSVAQWCPSGAIAASAARSYKAKWSYDILNNEYQKHA